MCPRRSPQDPKIHSSALPPGQVVTEKLPVLSAGPTPRVRRRQTWIVARCRTGDLRCFRRTLTGLMATGTASGASDRRHRPWRRAPLLQVHPV